MNVSRRDQLLAERQALVERARALGLFANTREEKVLTLWAELVPFEVIGQRARVGSFAVHDILERTLTAIKTAA